MQPHKGLLTALRSLLFNVIITVFDCSFNSNLAFGGEIKLYKSVYVKTHECFAKEIDCNEFYFFNVDIEDEANFLTLYDRDGTLAFKCRVSDIERFAKMQE